MSNLRLRVLSSVILAILVLGLTWLGGWPFRLLAACIAAAMLLEWGAMAVESRRHRWTNAVLLASVLVAVVAGYGAGPVVSLLAVCVVAAAVDAAVGREDAWGAAGLAYAGLSGISLSYLRGDDASGLVAILFLFAVVWATDIAAYFVGRAVGGPKLAPRISPGKTRSGAAGGALGGVLAGVLLGLAAGQDRLALLAGVALLLSVVSQAGDLFESWVKRRHGVKDSGRMIPGHGGVMDRADGLVAAALALYLLGCLAGDPDNPAQALFAI